MINRIKLLFDNGIRFIKKNKYISIGIMLFIIIMVIILIFVTKNSTYAINSTDYVNITCPETSKAGETISCDISVNISTEESQGMNISIIYDDLTFESFTQNSSCTKENGCYEMVSGNSSGIMTINLSGGGIKGTYTLGTFKYKVPDTAENGDIFTITFSNIKISNTSGEAFYTSEDVVKKIRIPSDVNTLNNITLDKGTLNEEFNKDSNIYTSTIDSDTLNITVEKTNEYSTIEGILENIKLHYGTNNIDIKVISETGKENIYTIKVFRPYTLTTDIYRYYKEDNNLYTKSDVNKDAIISNLNLPKELTGNVENNILTISYGEEKLTEINLINITSNKYSIANNKVYIGKNVDYDTFVNSLELSGVTIKIFDNNNEEITTGTLTENDKLKVYYKEELLEEYEFSEEYLNINTTKDDTNKILTRQEHDTTVETLLTKIDTSGTVTVKDKDSKEELDKTNIIKTGDTVEIALEEKTEIYTISVLGDINGDGKIDNGDVALLYNNLKGKKTFEKYQTFAGDIINDSSIKINDVARLYRFFKKRVDTLEVEK